MKSNARAVSGITQCLAAVVVVAGPLACSSDQDIHRSDVPTASAQAPRAPSCSLSGIVTERPPSVLLSGYYTVANNESAAADPQPVAHADSATDPRPYFS